MKNNKKIVLATGIFYPEAGGPAIHVRKIAERFSEEGFNITVITYSESKEPDNFNFSVKRVSKKYPKILRWFIYLFQVLRYGFSSSLIYAFDPSAAGLPAFLASKILRKKFVIRIGGDPIWERIVESHRRFMTLDEYYEEKLYKKDKPFLYKLMKFILSRSIRIVTYAQMWIDFYTKNYHIPKNKFLIIKNPFMERVEDKRIPKETTFLFAGRFVLYKNLEFVINSFNKIRNKKGSGKLILIGHGPDREILENLINKLNANEYIKIKSNMPQKELFEEISNSSVCLAPALTEFNPNFILECLSLNKPVLISKGNGLSVSLPEEFLFNPKDNEEFENKIERFFDQEFYKKSLDIVSNFDLNHNWKNVLDEHVRLVKEVIKS